MYRSCFRTYIPGIAIICALIGATAASAQETVTNYVMADVVRVRAAPEKGANVIANLRIATPVKVAAGGAAPEGWARVLLDTDPPLTGYTATAFLGRQVPKAANLLARYDAAMAAGDLKDARTAAERLAALEPDKDEHQERLKALYTKLGDTDGALRIDSHLKGGGIKYIGFCGGPLLASYQPGGGLTPWVRVFPYRTLDASKLSALRLGLQRYPWFAFDASTGKNRLLPAAYMLASRTGRANHDEVDAGETAYGASLKMPGCGKKGGIVSSEPMEPVEFGETDWSRAGKFITNEVAQDKNRDKYVLRSLNARTIGGTRPVVAVRADAVDSGGRKSSSRNVMQVPVWWLFDSATGELLARKGFYYGGESFVSARDVTWLKWHDSEALVAIVDYYVDSDASGNGSYTGIIVIDPKAGVKTVDLHLDWTMGG